MDKIRPAQSLLLRELHPGQTPVAAQANDSAAKEADFAKVDKAARQFEGMLLHEMLKSMWSTVQKSDFIGGSENQDDMFRDMMNQAVADTIAEGEGIGIREVITKDIRKLEKYKQQQ